ncbi:MAG: mercury(II) reductase [Actinobacteria bacterium]|nr:mercury(II) reductase [Actinomycetota bacterium]
MAFHKFDLVILGSGSTAFAAALRAAELGKTAAMTESRVLGGTCVNRGCLPSKNLIEAARLVFQAEHPSYPGLASATIEVDYGALIGQKDAVVEEYRGRKYQSIVTENEAIKVFAGDAHLEPDLSVRVGDEILMGERILVATGTRPHVPNIPGLESVPFLTSDLLGAGVPEELAERPASLLILGGGYVALELGQLFSRLGTQVTILEQGPELLHHMEPEVGPALREAFAAEGIEVLIRAHIQEVKAGGPGVLARVHVEGEERQLEAQHLLVATGRDANTEDLGLQEAGVEVDGKGFVRVNEYLRTTNARVYAAGDVVGSEQGSQLATPVGAHDGGIVARNALGDEQRRVDHRVIPRAIFVDPAVASVGLTDLEANRAGHHCSCRTVPLNLVPRAEAVHAGRGFIKMVLDRDTREVLGVTMVGQSAPEVIHEAAMAIRFRAREADFVDMIHVYPTMAEALKIVALSFTKDVSKLSCCAE